MALVRYGAGIVGMSGSIGGTTFARNRSGAYARARTTPINRKTDLQNNVRAALASLATRWAEVVTAIQRTAWNLYASNVTMKNRLGVDIKLTGYNHYFRSNAVLTLIGETLVDDGPVIFELPEQDPLFAFTAAETGPAISYIFDPTLEWATEVGAFMVKFQGKPQNAQRNFFVGPWRYHGIITGAVEAPSSPDEESDPPFMIAEGQAQWCYARIIRADGRLSEPMAAGPTLVGA